MKENKKLTLAENQSNEEKPNKERCGINNQTYEGILLHIPHSSILFPSDLNYSFKDLDDEEKLLIDYYTDELFMPQEKIEHIDSIIFPYCRLFCDVERLVNDSLSYKGLGISYRRIVNCNNLPMKERSFSTLKKAFNYYADFHAHVSKKIVNMTFMNRILLIDCHSFSSQPNLLNSNPPAIDICIGFNDDETRPNNIIIEKIVTHFKAYGYKVGINVPFSNSKTFAVPVNYHSIMIEVNKKLYMVEQTLEKINGFNELKGVINSLYEMLQK